MRAPKPALSEASRRRIHRAAGSDAGEDVGSTEPSALDAHLADTALHRRIFSYRFHESAPVAGQTRIMFHTDVRIRLHSTATAVIAATAGEQVGWSIKWAEDIDEPSPAEAWVTPPVAAGGGGPGDRVHREASFDAEYIPANSWVWYELVTVTGSVDGFALTIRMEEAPE
jgi:hypothetical protein